MADAETSGRICTAIMKLVELERTVKKRVAATRKEVETLAQAHGRTASLASATDAGIAAFVADLKSRRKKLVALIALAPDHENDAVLEDLLQIPELPAFPNSRAEQSESVSVGTKEGLPARSTYSGRAPALRQRTRPSGLDILDAPDHLKHLDACSCVVYDGEKKEWIELRCWFCGSNYTPATKTYLAGVLGMASHIRVKHQHSATHPEIFKECRQRAFQRKELENIISGKVKIAFVDGGEPTASDSHSEQNLEPAERTAPPRVPQGRRKFGRSTKRPAPTDLDSAHDVQHTKALPVSKRQRSSNVVDLVGDGSD